MSSIEDNAFAILAELDRAARDSWSEGAAISEATRLEPADVNDAVTLLVQADLAKWLRALGTAPYAFAGATITPRGRYALQESRASRTTSPAAENRIAPIELRPPVPVGSPYGFTDEHWETVARRKSETGVLYVVLGTQFESANYDTQALRTNIEVMFGTAIAAYRAQSGDAQLSLRFIALAAGYGEHLFNEIARDIIGADVAVFDTSDLNPNVMLEMGVALTWGVRVLPIKRKGTDKPPSDVSGQTWADYENSAMSFVDPEHQEKLAAMVDRVVRMKVRGASRS